MYNIIVKLSSKKHLSLVISPLPTLSSHFSKGVRGRAGGEGVFMKIKKYPKYAAFSDLMIYEYAAKITLQWFNG